MLYLLSICLIWLIFDQLTIINVRASNLNHATAFQDTPYLSDKQESESYILEKVINGLYGTIYYEPSQRYYIAHTQDAVAKINYRGDITFNYKKDVDYDVHTHLQDEHFLLTNKGIFNLHEETPTLHAYSEVRSLSDSINSQQWTKLFQKNYQDAQYVIFDPNYAKNSSSKNEEAIHFYIDGTWQTLINNENVGYISTANPNGNRYIFNASETLELKEKKHPLYIMKDVKRRTFSNINRDTDSYLAQFYEEDFPHKNYKYTPKVKVKVKKFKKEVKHNYPETLWFLLPFSWLPQQYEGEAIISLRIANEEITFKNKASRTGIGFGKVDTYLYLFDIPSQFEYEDSPIFIYNDEKRSMDVESTNAFYILKKK